MKVGSHLTCSLHHAKGEVLRSANVCTSHRMYQPATYRSPDDGTSLFISLSIFRFPHSSSPPIMTSDKPSSNPTSRSGVSASVEDLFYGFDICDEEARQFLASIVSSGQVPQDDLREVQQISLMRGVEEWDMLLDCASARRRQDSKSMTQSNGLQLDSSLVPYIEATLHHQPTVFQSSGANKGQRKRAVAQPGKSGRSRGVSRFWDDGSWASSERLPKQCRANAPQFRSAEPGGTENVSGPGREHKDPVGEPLHYAVVVAGSDGTEATPSSANRKAPNVPDDPSSAGVAVKSRNLDRIVSSKETTCTAHEFKKERGRAAKATGVLRSPFFQTLTPKHTPDKQSEATSPPPSAKKRTRPPRGTVSSLPIPPLSADRFGLIQEELADDPFRLLIAITFLIRTAGKAAIPVFRQLMERFPTPEALAAADPTEIVSMIHPLGLSGVRCAAIQKYARAWLEKPPTREVRYGVKNYPRQGDGAHVRAGDEFGSEDIGSGLKAESCPVDAVADARRRAIGAAWEIGHVTHGPYALDSWRIFCRDVLLGRSQHWMGRGNAPEFQPEWMRVLPRDKELRACLRWMWYVLISIAHTVSRC